MNPSSEFRHNPFSVGNTLRLIGLTLVTGVIYVLLKIQGKLRL